MTSFSRTPPPSRSIRHYRWRSPSSWSWRRGFQEKHQQKKCSALAHEHPQTGHLALLRSKRCQRDQCWRRSEETPLDTATCRAKHYVHRQLTNTHSQARTHTHTHAPQAPSADSSRVNARKPMLKDQPRASAKCATRRRQRGRASPFLPGIQWRSLSRRRRWKSRDVELSSPIQHR